MLDGNNIATELGDWESFAQPNGFAAKAEVRAQVKAGGLRFETYLPPGLADWLLDQIEDGIFADPQEAMFAIVGVYRDLEPHAAPREQLLRRAYLASVFDVPQPMPPGDDVKAQLRSLIDNPPARPAIWRNGS
jgi:antitoxin ParD1/3/4